MNNVLLPSGFDCSTEIGTFQKNPTKTLLGFQFFANDRVFFIFKDFFIISFSLLLPKRHLSHFLDPGSELSSGSGLQNQDHNPEWEMGQSLRTWCPGAWNVAWPPLQDRGTQGTILGCCSLDVSAFQTQLDLRVQLMAGSSQVSYKMRLTLEHFWAQGVVEPKQRIFPQTGSLRLVTHCRWRGQGEGGSLLYVMAQQAA